MDARLQRRVQRYGWDKAADAYERFWSRQLATAQARLLEAAAIRPGERVLDVAAGTGLVTLPAARAVGPTGRVLATDISQVMVDGLARVAAEAGLDWVETARRDAEDPGHEDGFDVALCALGLMYVPDPVACLTALFQALTPGGRALALVWGERGRCGWAEIFPIVDRRVASEVCPLFFQLGTGDALATAMSLTGFADVSLERISSPLIYRSADEALGAAFAGGPVALAYSRFDEDTRRAAHGEYLESIAPYREGDGYAIPGEFVLARGRRPGSA